MFAVADDLVLDLPHCGAAKAAAHLQDIPCPEGLAKEDASRNATTSITSGPGCVDDRDILARSSEFLGDIPTGQIVPKMNIGDDDIDPMPILQVAKSLVCVARFQNFISRIAKRID